MKVGVPLSSIVRLGGKAATTTEPLQLEKQKTNYKMTRTDFMAIAETKKLREQHCKQLEKTFNVYKPTHVGDPLLLKHLELEDHEYFEAFTIPKVHNGRNLTGGNWKPIDDFYLLERWIEGRDAGYLSYHENTVKAFKIWSMTYEERQEKLKTWQDPSQVGRMYDNGEAYNNCLASIDRIYGKKTEAILNEKRIIACTTTGAAKYGDRIRAASPTVVLVEEAGEILESHVLTALGPNTDQLVLIGDHMSVFFLSPLFSVFRVRVY